MTESAGFLLGGVSQKVATYAPCSVLICKGAVPVLDRMLLAVDGSDASKYAAQFLGKLPFKGPLRLMIEMVWGPSAFGSIGLCRQILICGPQNRIGQKQGGKHFSVKSLNRFRRDPMMSELNGNVVTLHWLSSNQQNSKTFK